MAEKITVIEALEMIASERGLSQDEVKEILVKSIFDTLESVYKIPEDRIHVEMGKKRGTLRLQIEKDVVKGDVENPYTQISLDEVNSLGKGSFNEGDRIKIQMPIEEFGRTAINKIKHFIFQKVREKEKEKQLEYYRGKIGEVITASIGRMPKSNGDLIINLEKIDGILPYEEQIRGEKLDFMRNKIKVYIKAVVDSWDEYYAIREEEEKHLIEIRRPTEQLKKYREKRKQGPYIILSRSDNNFIKARLVAEVPEIRDNIVEIKSIARIPGKRAKVAVYSYDKMVDPQGACIGRGGSRIKSIVRELGGEKIDIIEWTEEKVLFVKRALAPAKTIGVYFLEDNVVLVVVEDEQYPQAIGKDGMNVKLASALTGIETNIIKRSDFREDLLIGHIKDIEEVDALTESEKEILTSEGYITVDDVVKAGIEKLMEVKGIGKKKAEKIYKIVSEEKRAIDEIKEQKKQFLQDYLEKLEMHKEMLKSQNKIEDSPEERSEQDGEE